MAHLDLVAIAHEGDVFCLNIYLHVNGFNIDSTNMDGETALFLAIKRKDEPAVQTLISAGADVNHKNVYGDTPLMMAAYLGAVNMLRMLKMVSSLDESNAKGQTALMFACFGNHATCVQALIDLGASVNLADIHGTTAVMLASQEDESLEYLDILIAAGADVNATNNKGLTPLMLASREGALGCIKSLTANGININTMDRKGMSAFMLPETAGHADCRRKLIFAGCDTDVRENNGNTALILATMFDKLECVKLLLKTLWETDVNAQNNEGMTALMFATLSSHSAILHELLMAGAKTDLQNAREETALMISIEKGVYKSFRCLLKAGASIHVTNHDGQNPLMLAAANPDTRYVSTLMQTIKARGLFPGDYISKRDKCGNTALMIATERGLTDNLEILIRRGAKFNDINDKIELTQVLASLAGHEKCARLLIQRYLNDESSQQSLMKVVSDIVKAQIGAEVNVYFQDKLGRTLLHWAASVGQDHKSRRSLMYFMAFNEPDGMGREQYLLEMDQERSLISQLLCDCGLKVNVQDENGMSALMLASWKGMVKTVQTLLDCGAQVNLIDNSGKTALMHVTDENASFVTTLVKYGSDVNVQDESGMTAIMMAYSNGTSETVQTLLEDDDDEDDDDDMHDINERSWVQSSVLVPLVKKLVTYGSDLNMKNENGMTALMMSCAGGKVKIVHTLLDCGADVNLQDHTGKTALMHLTSKNEIYEDESDYEYWSDEDELPLDSVVGQLVGADVNMRDEKGMTAVMYAAASSRGWSSPYLISALARIHACLDLLDNEGKSALVHALENCDPNEPCETVFTLLTNNAFPKLEITKSCPVASVFLLRFFENMSQFMCYEYTEAVVLTRLLVSNGIIPNEGIRHFRNREVDNGREKWSPLLQTLQQEYDYYDTDLQIAKYLVANCYMSTSDMDRIRSDDLPSLDTSVKNFLKQAFAKPWPLVKLAQIAVSTAIGPSPGRQERILQTGLPRPIMDCLIFDRPIALLHNDWEDIPVCFDPTQYSLQPFQYPLLQYWPFGHRVELCDCDVCKQKDDTLKFTKIVKS